MVVCARLVDMDDLDMALALEREESYKASKNDRKTARTDNRKKAKKKRKGTPNGPNKKNGSTELRI